MYAIKNDLLPTDEILSKIGYCEKTTSEFARAHGCCDSSGKHLHFITPSYPIRYIVSNSLRKTAIIAYEQMKQEKLSKIKNKLVFVAMGCSYNARYPDDVCNHRIRTSVINPFGRHFFIELSSGNNDNMHFDFVIDRDQEKHYEAQRAYFRDQIIANGGFAKTPKNSFFYTEYEYFSRQPYYWYKKSYWYDLKIKHTTANVIKVVNELFDCHFTEFEISNYLLSPDDFNCVSPKL